MKVNKKFLSFIIACIIAICSCATKFYLSDSDKNIQLEIETTK